MAAKVRTTDGIPIPKLESKPSNTVNNSISNTNQIEIEIAKCVCCSLIEECTPEYIAKIRERYNGRWICGLCSEAVKDEIYRSKRLISTEEALNRHMSFSNSFKSSPMNSTEELISAMRQLLRRSLHSPRSVRSTPTSPRRKDSQISLARSESCFSTIGG